MQLNPQRYTYIPSLSWHPKPYQDLPQPGTLIPNIIPQTTQPILPSQTSPGTPQPGTPDLSGTQVQTPHPSTLNPARTPTTQHHSSHWHAQLPSPTQYPKPPPPRTPIHIPHPGTPSPSRTPNIWGFNGHWDIYPPSPSQHSRFCQGTRVNFLSQHPERHQVPSPPSDLYRTSPKPILCPTLNPLLNPHPQSYSSLCQYQSLCPSPSFSPSIATPTPTLTRVPPHPTPPPGVAAGRGAEARSRLCRQRGGCVPFFAALRSARSWPRPVRLTAAAAERCWAASECCCRHCWRCASSAR